MHPSPRQTTAGPRPTFPHPILHICIYLYIYTHTNTHTHTHTHMHTYIRTHTCIHTHTHTQHAYIKTYVHSIHTYIHTHAWMHVCIHLYTTQTGACGRQVFLHALAVYAHLHTHSVYIERGKHVKRDLPVSIFFDFPAPRQKAGPCLVDEMLCCFNQARWCVLLPDTSALSALQTPCLIMQYAGCMYACTFV